jgi:hypothetical protein
VPTVIFGIHPVAEHILDGEILGAAVEAGTAMRRAIAAHDLLVVALEYRDVVGAELAARGNQILVDVLQFVE